MQTSKHPALYFPDNGSHIQTGFHASVLRCFFQKDHVRNRITCPDLWRKLLPFTFQPSEICKSLAAVIRTHQTLYHLDMVSHVMAHSTEISIQFSTSLICILYCLFGFPKVPDLTVLPVSFSSSERIQLSQGLLLWTLNNIGNTAHHKILSFRILPDKNENHIANHA